MNQQLPPNPLYIGIVCPNCKQNAVSVAAHRYGECTVVILLCTCGAVLIIGEAPVIGAISKPVEGGVDIHVGTMLGPSTQKILVPNRRIPAGPSNN